MKKLVLFIMMCATLTMQAQKKNNVLNQGEGTITFVVDGKLPAPKQMKAVERGQAIEVHITGSSKNLNKSKGTVTSSFRDDQFCYMGASAFFHSLVFAYCDHRPVVLSPDMIWELISLGFSQFVNKDPEAVRHLLVQHEGKKTLTVESEYPLYSPEVRWDDILTDFEKQIDANTTPDFTQTMVADFSTTGKVERIVSQMTMMSSVKAFFDFVVHYIACGIPSITLEGTTADWQSVMDRTMKLKDYGMDWWVKDLSPILQQFVDASQGKVDRKFWKGIVKKERVSEMQNGGGCSLKPTTRVDGWFLKLMPYTEKGRTPESVPYNFDGFEAQMSTTPFIYQIRDNGGTRVLESQNMEMWAGFVGADIDSQTGTVRPKMGWMIREADSEKDLIKTLEKDSNEPLRIDHIPGELRNVTFLGSLELWLKGNLVIPEWIDSLRIDELKMSVRHTPEDVKELERRLPHYTIKSTDGRSLVLKAKQSLAPDDYVYPLHSLAINWPRFDGDEEAYIDANCRIPRTKRTLHEKVHSKNDQVRLYFTVNKDGSISDITAQSSDGKKEQEAEAIRLYQTMPKWTPAKDKFGNNVNARCTDLVYF